MGQGGYNMGQAGHQMVGVYMCVCFSGNVKHCEALTLGLW